MVTEAVAELKGEEAKPPAEVKLDLPFDAHLPKEYVAREDLRLSAYRRLAAVTSESEVTDIRAEWEDRFGPVPEPAEALLEVARLRAECHRTGVREVTVARGMARLAPLPLRTSQALRLQRLHREAVYKEDLSQLQLPARKGVALVGSLVDVLRELVPVEEAA